MAVLDKDSYSNYEEIFKKDTIVEVSSEDEGLRGSWYTATVLRAFSRKTHKILVEYHNLMADDAGSKPLREFVPAILIRPIPPREPHRVFSLMDDVDAFHNDGWWEGVVTKISIVEDLHHLHQLPVTVDVSSISLKNSCNCFCYSVFFRCSREQIDFCSPDLRLHREWVPRDNLWVPPLENLSLLHHASSGQRKRNGEDGRNGYHSSGDKDRVVTRDGARRTTGTPTKQDGVMNNGRCKDERRNSSCTVNNGVMGTIRKDEKLRISSNGASKKHGLTSNGKSKRRRARKW